MLGNVKIYTSDKYWNHILADLGACLVETPDIADVIFDELSINAPISVDDLQSLVVSQFNAIWKPSKIGSNSSMNPAARYLRTSR